MRLIFAGTPLFAERALAALIEAGHDIAAVLTQPDRKAGRGMQPAASPVKGLALSKDIKVLQPAKMSEHGVIDRLASYEPELLVVAAYGLILPQAVLDLGPRGAVNIHASLLPRWRGAAPIHRAILAGDTQSGITLMQMDAGLDTGAILAMESTPISDEETTGTLHDRLAAMGAQMIVALLASPTATWSATPQPAEGITYARKIEKSEAVVDWRRSNLEIDRQVRAFNPAPGARASIEGADLKLWRARPVAAAGEPGRVLSVDEDGVLVGCGAGALALTELQRAGGKRLGTRDYLRGHAIAPGARFEVPEA